MLTYRNNKKNTPPVQGGQEFISHIFAIVIATYHDNLLQFTQSTYM